MWIYSQTKIYSFTHYQFNRYSLEYGNKIWQELYQNKLMSDTFDRKVCNELGWIAVRIR